MRRLYCRAAAPCGSFLVLMSCLLAPLSSCADFQQKGAEPEKTKAEPQEIDLIEELASPAPAIVTSSFTASLRSDTASLGFPVTDLAPGTVVQVNAHTRSESGSSLARSWCQLTTRSGNHGWTSCENIEFVTTEQAEEFSLRDQQQFESRVRRMILAAAEGAIDTSRVHPISNLREIWVTSPLASASSSSAEANVSALMTGRYLHFNQYQVDVRVNLFLDLNRDNLSQSTVEIQEARVIGNKLVDGVTPDQAVGLFSLIL